MITKKFIRFSLPAILLYGFGAVSLGVTSSLAQVVIDGGQIVTVPGSQNSPWNIGTSLRVGDTGSGELVVGASGVVVNTLGYIGYGANSIGSVTVSGAGAQWNSTGMYVGFNGTGVLEITDGGILSNVDSFIGYGANSTGTVTVNGAGSQWNGTSAIYVGHQGDGALNITGGGVVSSTSSAVGNITGSTGVVTVTGPGSKWTNSGDLYIGRFSREGSLDIATGGVVSNVGGFIGYAANSAGEVTVNGAGSQWNGASVLYVGYGGDGTLTISDSGTVNASEVTIAEYDISTGVLNVGAAEARPAVAPGILSTSKVTFGSGTSSLVFNHTDMSGNYEFAPALTGGTATTTTVDVYAGTTVMVGAGNDYFGRTAVYDGAVLVAGSTKVFSPNSDYDVQSGAMLDLRGNSQTILSLVNAGVVNMGTDTTPGTVLTVAGNYSGNGGAVHFNTVLGDDASATDLLVVAGETAGSTSVKITNAGGTGAQTVEGIKIIEVGGASEGNFTLLGNYETLDNRQAIRGGAYAYTLEHNGISTPTDGNWYLRSTLQEPPVDPDQPGEPEEPGEPGQPETPRYDAGAPVYEAYPQALLALNGVSTLQQRVGNRVWADNGNKVIAEGADAISTPYAPPEEAGTHIEGNGVWGRIEGAHNHIETGRSTTEVFYDQNIFKLHAGVDGMLMENENGKLIGGISVHYAHGLTKTASIYDAKTGGGRISTDGYGLGGTLTWYGENGLYIDAQAQATWYNSDLSYAGGNQSLIEGNDGFGYALSIEGGKRIALDPAWSLTPQAQLVYSSVDFDDFHDADNITVGLDRGESLQGRLGLTLDHQTAWQNANGMLDRAHVYGIANLYYEFLEGTRVNIADVSFANQKDRLWGGIGLGGSYNWNDDKYSIYGEALVNTSLNNFADSYSLQGNVGFRVKW